MKIDVARLDEGGESFEGAEDSAILEWTEDNEVLQPGAPVHYALRAQRLGDELLVRGTISTAFDALCCRCGKPLKLAVRDSEFCVSLPLPPDAEFVDLTSELREAILLSLPNHPVCAEECHAPALSAPVFSPAPAGWEVLDSLRLPKKPKKASKSHGGTQTKKV